MLIIETFTRAHYIRGPPALSAHLERAPLATLTASPALHRQRQRENPCLRREAMSLHGSSSELRVHPFATTYASVISAEYADLIVTSRRTAAFKSP